MGFGTICASFCVACCYTFVPFVLQTVGLTPMWASNSTCDSIGLVYSCCAGPCKNTNGGDELDVRALGLHATSSMVMFLTVFCLCCVPCCSDDDDDDVGCWSDLVGCCLMLYPVAGLFSTIGCIIVATKSPTLGYSFYLCLTAGCLIIVLAILICYLKCKDDADLPPMPTRVAPSNTRRGSCSVSSVTSYASGGGSVAPYQPRQQEVHVEAQHESVEQVVAVHDRESGNVFFLLRKINITRVFSPMKQN